MTKYVIRRIVQAIPVLFGITIVVYAILLAAPGGPTAKFANNPRMTNEQTRGLQEGLGPRSADPDPVLPLAGRLQPGRRRALGTVLIGPTGWPNFLPSAISGADERRPPRRLRLLDRPRRAGRRHGSPGPRCRRSSWPASPWSSGSRSRS